MSDDGNSNCNADTLANNLFTTLIAGEDFTLPAVDFDDPQFDIPSETGNSLYDDIPRLTEADLTERKVNGAGMFDGIMSSIDAHIRREYEAGRITGKDYAEAYMTLTQTALGSAVQYLLAKDQSFYQAQLAQMQARAAEIAAVGERIRLETARAQLATARIETKNMSVEYSKGKLQLSILDSEYCVKLAQKANVTADTDLKAYQLSDVLPAQVGQVQAETAIRDYEHDNVLPKEVLRLQSGIDVDSAKISQLTAQTNQVLYETSGILPSTKDKLDAEAAVANYNLTAMMPAQLAGIQADTATKVYTKDHLLPAQVLSTEEQAEAHRAKTLDTRSDGTTPIKGAIGKQKDLHAQQIDSYQRSDEWKIAKGLLDTWITQKSLDEGLTPPSSLTDSNINTVMNKIRNNTNLD